MSLRDARPLWGEIDLPAVTHNVALIRRMAGRPVNILAPVKANAYGHGVVEIGRHLAGLGVEGLATANVEEAIALRRAGVACPILLYGAQLPAGNAVLLEHRLTPTIHGREGLEAVDALGRARGAPVPVHVKVDAGLGRLGVRLDEAADFVASLLDRPGLILEGIYTHIPFSDAAGADWSARRLRAFADLVAAVETRHGMRIAYAQAGASAVLAGALPDRLNTVAPGHLTFGLSPLAGRRAETLGFRKALRALRARLIHVGRRRAGDDLIGTGPGGLGADATTGVILFGMDNGYRPAAPGRVAHVLCGGRRCPVLAVSAEYSVIDLSGVDAPRLGDLVTVIGDDGDAAIAVEDVAADQGAPSAAYWQIALRSVPLVVDRG